MNGCKFFGSIRATKLTDLTINSGPASGSEKSLRRWVDAVMMHREGHAAQNRAIHERKGGTW